MRPTQPGHILLVESDTVAAKPLCAGLGREGLRWTLARSCAEARHFVSQHPIDLILLDRLVFASAGAAFGRELRVHDECTVPILTFNGDDEPHNILGRTRALLAAAACSLPGKFEGFGIVLDPGAQRALYRGRDIRLAAAQFRLLEYFLKNPGRILSRHELFATLWGEQGSVGRRVDVYVGNLRKLLGNPNGNKLIRTVRGAGYVFDGDEAKGRRLPGRPRNDHEVMTTYASASVDQFRLDYADRSLRIDGVQFSLSPREFAVLELLMLNPDMTFNRSMIANCIWAEDKVDLRTVDATISRLRKAIKQRSSSDRPIRSVIGRGYQFSA